MKIISNGQNGVAIGALRGVERYNKKYPESGVSTSGYYPKGTILKDGKKYGLREDVPTPGFTPKKSCYLRNVDEADIVIGFLGDKNNNTILKTCWYALHGEYKNMKVSFDKNNTKFYEGWKKTIFVNGIDDSNFEEIIKEISQIVNSSKTRNIMVIGGTKNTLEKLIEYLIFEVLCEIHGKIEY